MDALVVVEWSIVCTYFYFEINWTIRTDMIVNTFFFLVYDAYYLMVIIKSMDYR